MAKGLFYQHCQQSWKQYGLWRFILKTIWKCSHLGLYWWLSAVEEPELFEWPTGWYSAGPVSILPSWIQRDKQRNTTSINSFAFVCVFFFSISNLFKTWQPWMTMKPWIKITGHFPFYFFSHALPQLSDKASRGGTTWKRDEKRKPNKGIHSILNIACRMLYLSQSLASVSTSFPRHG